MITEVETKIGISEIFLSIQGEGIYTGLPTIFVRFQGCDLGCIWCDSKYTWKLGKEKDKWTSQEILDRLLQFDKTNNTNVDWVCITGGEPLQQYSGFCEIVSRIKRAYYNIEVETSGLIPLPTDKVFREVDSWVVDLKLSSSGVTLSPILEDFKRLRVFDQVKVVISESEDFIYTYDILHKYPTSAKILISPKFKNDGTVDQKLLQGCVDFCISNNYRLSLQTHKYIWGMKRGV